VRTPAGRRPSPVPGALWLLAALPLGCSARDVTTATPPAVGRFTSAPEHVPDVQAYAKVSDVLCRGAQPSQEGFAELRRRGVRTVISLRVFDQDRALLSGLGLRYRHISFKVFHPEDEDVLAFLKIVTDPANRPVFVHCRDGVDRTGMMVAVYRIIVQGWSKANAVSEMRRMGFREINWPIEQYLDRMDAAALKRELAKLASPPVNVVP